MRKVNSKDVAREAGVSQATVSYVLTGREDQTIRAETRRKVLDAAELLGYFPNLAARALVTGKTHTIALWVPFSHHSVFGHVIEQIMHLALKSGYRVVIAQTAGETSETLGSSGLLSDWHVDGILAFDATEMVNKVLDQCPGVSPIVSFGPTYSDRTDHVGIDLYEGSLRAVRYLAEIGCSRIAYSGFQPRLFPGEPRYDAYMKVMQEIGAKPIVIPLLRGEYEDAYHGIRDHIAAFGCPDGLFCWNDEAAIGANRAFADLGLRVPEDVALIGSDGIRETAYCVPGLSTIAQPFEEMCRLAWDFLQRRLQEPSHPVQHALLPMQMEKRASTNRE